MNKCNTYCQEKVSAVVLTRPSYQGAMRTPAAFRSIISLCHAENIPVIVDEAHGAHIRFFDDDNMQGLKSSFGIDIDCVCSSSSNIQ